MSEKKKKTFNVKGVAIILTLFFIVMIAIIYLLFNNIPRENNESNSSKNTKSDEVINEEKKSVNAETKKVVSENEYAIKDNNLSKFDLSFLKFENEEKNKIYSPLSIKYAFKMLEEGTTGDAHNQISSIIEAYNLTEYESNENMSLANALFIRDDYRDFIKDSYINNLKTKYNADVEFDNFLNSKNINNWVKENTLNLIPDLFEDSNVNELNFALINALGIDMEWNHKFLEHSYEDDTNITFDTYYEHERIPTEEYRFEWFAPSEVTAKKFDNNQKVSSMQVYASFNNYDILSDIGEDAIRQTVYEDFKQWANSLDKNSWEAESFNGDFSEENIKKTFDDWFDNTNEPEQSYINLINKNYGKEEYSTDFEIYVDDDVKVFAKDLKNYNGTTLQYIGIMPKNEDLSVYINNITNEDIIQLIGNLKELKRENFKDGYLTYIHGYIPKFKFEYELNLQEDLKKLGITDVFEQGKASLTRITDDDSVYIDSAKHKANIEFTQDGIKAAAATMAGGAGAGEWYDYFFEMPTEDIDITFDKPYMFLIRDKETSETWFVGTVYEPLDSSEDLTVDYIYDAIEDMEEEY